MCSDRPIAKETPRKPRLAGRFRLSPVNTRFSGRSGVGVRCRLESLPYAVTSGPAPPDEQRLSHIRTELEPIPQNPPSAFRMCRIDSLLRMEQRRRHRASTCSRPYRSFGKGLAWFSLVTIARSRPSRAHRAHRQHRPRHIPQPAAVRRDLLKVGFDGRPDVRLAATNNLTYHYRQHVIRFYRRRRS